MSHKKPDKDILIENAKDIIANVHEDEHLLSGACIVSSLPAGDSTPVSDVDMLMLAADNEVKPVIHRRLVGDKVFEWIVAPNDYLRDVDRILAHAGICHDILTMIILLDTDDRLEQVKQEVASQYQAPQWIWKRTLGQLQRAAGAIEQIQKHLTDGDILSAQRAHVSALFGLFSIPRVILNKRPTHARGSLFCLEAATELGWPEYQSDALTVLGSAGISEKQVVNLQDIAVQIIAATKFTKTEKAIRQWFLRSSNWLLENAQPADAVWPLYTWSNLTVEESGGDRNPIVLKHWQEFTAILGVGKEQALLAKMEKAQRLYESAVKLLETTKNQGILW
ncbi:MAG: hypothetical protein Q7N50_13735 [Armatimonadota bacterium]|nr:hypothetical protein [Armatimonadota bacterium]